MAGSRYSPQSPAETLRDVANRQLIPSVRTASRLSTLPQDHNSISRRDGASRSVEVKIIACLALR